MKRALPPEPLPSSHDCRATAVDGLPDAGYEGLSEEIEGILAGRIRDVELSGRLFDLYRETSWRQRSRIARAWLIWAMRLSFPMVVLDWLYQPHALDAALLMRGPFLLASFAALTWVWARPRAVWIEGASLPFTVAVLMLIGSVIGKAGGGGALHHYLSAAVFAASTAIVIFPVSLVWTVVGTAAALFAFVAVGLSEPVPQMNVITAFGLFFALVLGTLVLSRRTMTIIQQHAFLLNLRNGLQTRALADANARLAVLANTDALTGLANRRAYQETVGRLWADASDPPRSLGIVLFDIDHFKRLNDTAGHAVGDRCLVAIAEQIRRIMPARGVCARYGGEEFICVLSDATPRGVLHLAEQLRAAVEALSWPNPGIGRSVTVSLGVAVATTDRRPESLADLVTAADAALYRAKEGGRNRVAAVWDAPSAGAASGPLLAESL